ncbi:nitrilase-related carbon-nitrogen hydrolase [Haliangium sp.]|uniref:nitrilase-related carbon-nitrogen hydrolase n=1 Tax=Haliangium sp. TaxID=2663208 RepID=UPI003D0E059B
MKPFVAAVIQAAPVAFDVARTLVKLRDLAADAARAGARLAVFPEAFVSVYPRGLDFGVRVGSRTPAGREMFRRYHEASIDVPGPAVDAIAEAAADHGLHLVVGVIERDGATLYCSVLFFGPDGTYLGERRKLVPTAAERVIWGRGDGSTLPVYDTSVGKLGAVICWENYMPLLRTAMYARGIELYCAPTADGRPSWIPSMQHIALEGRCFVLSCNQFARRSDYPDDYPLPAPAGDSDSDDLDPVISTGGSAIVGPYGDLLAGPDYQGERVLTAELDLDELVRAKMDFDVVGHYARPDVFQLHVDERPQTTVVRRGPAIETPETLETPETTETPTDP